MDVRRQIHVQCLPLRALPEGVPRQRAVCDNIGGHRVQERYTSSCVPIPESQREKVHARSVLADV